MGQNNRQRRAAKQRRRVYREHSRPRDSASTLPDPAELAPILLAGLIRQRAGGAFGPVGARDAFAALPVLHQQRAIEAQSRHLVDARFGGGWTPVDLAEFAQRTATEHARSYLLGVMAVATAAHPPSRVHPRWRAQLGELGAQPMPLSSWGDRVGRAWPEFVDDLVALLAGVITLPVIEAVLPPPGADPRSDDAPVGIDPKTLRRVRALLAKAESTEFEHEADALSAMAQRLMTQYSIDEALAERPVDRPRRPSTRRIWLDNPYILAKGTLVAEIAKANRCRCVITERLGFVTLIGFDTDLDVVDLLTTSLLLQATRAMRLAGSQTTRTGVSRTRSFRQSFLVAYAARVGERLREAAHAVGSEQDAEHAGRLLPVLAARDRAVDEEFDATFPRLVSRGISASNAAGWGAGRAAADLAVFDTREALARQTSA